MLRVAGGRKDVKAQSLRPIQTDSSGPVLLRHGIGEGLWAKGSLLLGGNCQDGRSLGKLHVEEAEAGSEKKERAWAGQK